MGQRQEVGIAAGGEHLLQPAVLAQLGVELHQAFTRTAVRSRQDLHGQQARERIDARRDEGPTQLRASAALKFCACENAGTISCTPEKSSAAATCVSLRKAWPSGWPSRSSRRTACCQKVGSGSDGTVADSMRSRDGITAFEEGKGNRSGMRKLPPRGDGDCIFLSIQQVFSIGARPGLWRIVCQQVSRSCIFCRATDGKAAQDWDRPIPNLRTRHNKAGLLHIPSKWVMIVPVPRRLPLLRFKYNLNRRATTPRRPSNSGSVDGSRQA
jgi:hypothetical protein